MLNFDPKQFLAESRESVAGLATLAGCRSEIENAISNEDPAKVARVAKPEVTEAEARSILRGWHQNLSKLDEFIPPQGFTSARWADLVTDACWLYETYASQLVREGWGPLDCFGVLPWRPGGGVLLDRLHGARNLRLDGQGRAIWSVHGVTFVTCRGAAEALVSSGLVAVWDL